MNSAAESKSRSPSYRRMIQFELPFRQNEERSSVGIGVIVAQTEESCDSKCTSTSKFDPALGPLSWCSARTDVRCRVTRYGRTGPQAMKLHLPLRPRLQPGFWPCRRPSPLASLRLTRSDAVCFDNEASRADQRFFFRLPAWAWLVHGRRITFGAPAFGPMPIASHRLQWWYEIDRLWPSGLEH
jgi:hypothetical protein